MLPSHDWLLLTARLKYSYSSREIIQQAGDWFDLSNLLLMYWLEKHSLVSHKSLDALLEPVIAFYYFEGLIVSATWQRTLTSFLSSMWFSKGYKSWFFSRTAF